MHNNQNSTEQLLQDLIETRRQIAALRKSTGQQRKALDCWNDREHSAEMLISELKDEG